jgi:hypothetical protein
LVFGVCAVCFFDVEVTGGWCVESRRYVGGLLVNELLRSPFEDY